MIFFLLFQVAGGQESSGRRITSKYFNSNKQKGKDEKEKQELPAKRKNAKDSEEIHEDDGDDSVLPTNKKKLADTTPTKKLKSGSGRGLPQKSAVLEESDEDDDKDAMSAAKSAGRGGGGGGRGAPGRSTGGRGRGGGRGGFMNFGERKDPPHKGEKVQIYEAYGSIDFFFGQCIETSFVCQEVPEGAPDCLAGLTFVISGTLDRYLILYLI